MANPTVSVTNSSGLDVEIFDVYNPGTGDQQVPFQYTSLGKISNGQTSNIATIRMASQLLAVYTGNLTLANNTFYYQNFPVSVNGVSVLDDTPITWTISPDDSLSMQQAFLFIKYTSANPNSTLSTDFQTAMKNDNQETAVNAYFASTGSFPKATLSSWTQIISWQTQFMSAWQGPYYLYNTPTGDETVKLIAVVNIVSSASANSAKIYVASQDGTYSPSSQNVDLVQSGAGTITESQPGVSPLSVSLTPVWMNISSVDNSGNVTYGIGGAMSGTFNGTNVMGTGQKLDIPSSGSGGSGSGSDGGQTAQQVQNTISTLVNTLISFGMLFIMYKQWQEGKTKAKDDVVNKAQNPEKNKDQIKQEQQAAEAQVDAQEQPKVEQQQKEAQKAGQDLPQQRQDVVDAQKDMTIQKAVEEQSGKLRDLLMEVPPNANIEQAVQKFEAAKTDIENGDFDSAFKNLTDASTIVNTEANGAESGFTAEQKATSDKIKEDLDAAKSQQDSAERAEQRIQDEDGAKPSEKVDDSRLEPPKEDGFGE